MRRSFTQPSTRSTRRFLPTLESLESRWCPSAAGVFQQGHTLVIQGDGSNDTISVSDDGKGDITASITLAGGTKTISAVSIKEIDIHAGGGNDTIGYALTGTLSQSEKLHLTLGKGSSQVNLDFSAGIADSALAVFIGETTGSNKITTEFGAITGSRVNLTEILGPAGSTTHVNFGGPLSSSDPTVVIRGGAGADQVFAAVGDETNANVQFFSYFGKGANTFDLESTGNLVNSIQHFEVDASSGDNTVTFDAKGVNVDMTSRLNLQSYLGVGNDTVTENYSGVMDGELDGVIDLGAGNDTLNVNVTLDSGSNGRLHMRAYGGRGDDNLTFDVFDNSNPGGKSTMALLDAILFSVLGHDTDNTTPNVKVIK
jgi:hypothetical protein